MKNIIKILHNKCEQSEVYFSHSKSNVIDITNKKVNNIKSSLHSGISLRIIKNGKLGFSYTNNLIDINKFIKQALDSSDYGCETSIEFPKTKDNSDYKEQNIDIDKNILYQEAQRINDYINKKSNGQVDIYFDIKSSEIGIINSSGTNIKHRQNELSTYISMPFKESSSCVLIRKHSKTYNSFDISEIDNLITLYSLAENHVIPTTGNYKVIMMPEVVSKMINRFEVAANPHFIHNRTSPITNQMNKNIFSEKLTIFQDHLNNDNIFSVKFDDEGVACKNLSLVDKGVLKNIYTDLHYAKILGLQPTGNGFKKSISNLPKASIPYANIAPGNSSLEELISSNDKAIIIHSVMADYCGNILNGDFSVGISTGFYIKSGKITARVTDCMLTGNIYELFNEIEAIENRSHYIGARKLPAILFNNVKITSN